MRSADSHWTEAEQVKAFFYLIAVVSGLSNPVQSAANAALNKATHQPLLTAIATLLVVVACYAAVRGLSFAPLREAATTLPWWVYVGGACNIVFVLASAVATQKIGSGAFTVTTLVSAVILSIVLDGNGLMGPQHHPVTWPRIVRAGLSIAGVLLVSMF